MNEVCPDCGAELICKGCLDDIYDLYDLYCPECKKFMLVKDGEGKFE